MSNKTVFHASVAKKYFFLNSAGILFLQKLERFGTGDQQVPSYLFWLASASAMGPVGIIYLQVLQVSGPKHFLFAVGNIQADSNGILRFWEKSCLMQSSSVYPTTRKNYNYEYEHLVCRTDHFKIGVAAVRLRKSMCTDTNSNSCRLQKCECNKKRKKMNKMQMGS